MQVEQVVILAGGLGTRLGKLTNNIPKALIEINNKPFIEWQINYFVNQGKKKFLLCLGHFSDQIIEFVKNKFPDNEIIFSLDGKKMLGTGGALVNAFDQLEEKFFVVYGDSYLQVDLKDMESRHGIKNNVITMAIFKNNNMYDKSNIQILDKNLRYYENSSEICDHIDYGVSIISKKILSEYNLSSFINLSQIYENESKKNKINYYLAKNRFYEIGSEKGIFELNKFLKTINS
tara:strand:+ start:487 stop:1185 length:699 start_codon:yes stop_codon:yes gene_type:complete